jgi:hypothetical protein
MNLKRIFLWGLISSLVSSGLLGIFIFLFADLHETLIKILFTTLDIGACSLAALCCSTILDTRFRALSVFGIGVSVLCMIHLIYTIWWFDKDANFDILLSLVVVSASCAHICLILLTKTTTQTVMFVLGATVVFIATVGGMLLLLIWRSEQGEFFYRLLGVFGILDVLGTIISPIMGKSRKYEDVLE